MTKRSSAYNALQFFNILEPGKFVISVSKAGLWIIHVLVIYQVLVLKEPINAALLGALAAAWTNYGVRRVVASHDGYPGGDLGAKRLADVSSKHPDED